MKYKIVECNVNFIRQKYNKKCNLQWLNMRNWIHRGSKVYCIFLIFIYLKQTKGAILNCISISYILDFFCQCIKIHQVNENKMFVKKIKGHVIYLPLVWSFIFLSQATKANYVWQYLSVIICTIRLYDKTKRLFWRAYLL